MEAEESFSSSKALLAKNSCLPQYLALSAF